MSASSRPHVHYVAAVVDELARRGLEVSDWQLDAGQPLAGWVTLASTSTSTSTSDSQHGPVVCGWCEERGWLLGRDSDRLERTRSVGGTVLPAPGVIAEQLAQALTTLDTLLSIPRNNDHPYRASGDDDGLRARLAAYALPERDQDS